MSDAHFIEHCVSSEPVFDGELLKVSRDRIRKDGETGEWTREYVRHPGATLIIAINADGKLIFERQFRYPLGRVIIELPAGKIDPDEDPAICAQRELEEETGYRADHWERLGTVHPAVGYSNERIEVFLARGLHHVGQRLDEGEYLELLEWSFEEAERAVIEGRITDGKTIAALFMVRGRLHE